MVAFGIHARSLKFVLIGLMAFFQLRALHAAEPAASGPNLFANPGFEDGGKGWTVPKPFALGNAAENAHSGSGELTVTMAAKPAYQNTFQRVDVTPETYYLAGLWAKGSGKFQIQVLDQTWNEMSPLVSIKATASDSWQQVRLPAFNSRGNKFVFFLIRDRIGGGGTVHFDDCFFHAVAAKDVPAGDVHAGPAPFPNPKDESAWPGRGPIRVFNFMVGEREAIWRNHEKNRGAVVFVGDSLTGGWKDLGKSFPDLKVANSGVGGDTSRGVLWRFREDVLDLKPRTVVICIGFNDLTAGGKPADAVANIDATLKQAWAANPDLPIALCLVPPREAPQVSLRPGAIADLNARIVKLGEGKKHLEVVDLVTPFTGPDGKPKVELFVADHVHLSAAGYHVWAVALRPALDKLGVK
jgi:lysophospholipase L1-like esterase